MKAAKRRTFATLDGLRGLAALLVVYHHQHLAGINGAPPSAYLAVDLFFLMSGFVIAHAYEDKLSSGMAPLAFMRLRLIRLYPLYLLGSVVGLGVALAFWRLSAVHPTNLAELVRVTMLGLVMAPTFSPDATVMAFPLNGPAWSLFFELGVNLIYAVAAVRLSSRWLSLTCAACAGVMAILALRGNDLNVGFQTLSFLWGVPRVALSFFAGVLIYRLHRSGKLPRIAVSPLWALVLALGLIAAPIEVGPIGALVVVTVGFPMVLLLAVCAEEPASGLARPFALLGEASYPLYAIHGPIVVGLMMASRFWGWDLPGVRLEVAFALPLALSAVALVLSRRFDQPIRAWLGRIGAPALCSVPLPA